MSWFHTEFFGVRKRQPESMYVLPQEIFTLSEIEQFLVENCHTSKLTTRLGKSTIEAT